MLLMAAGIGAAASNRALLIGISDYDIDATGWPPLSGSNDVELLEGKLEAKGFHVNTLKNSDATKEQIRSALSDLVDTARTGDIIYIHFSGHGQLVEDMNGDEPDGLDQSFVCIDACFSPRFTVDGQPYAGQNHFIDDELVTYFNGLKAKVGSGGRIVVAFDSCYSGGIDRNDKLDRPDPESEVEFSSISRGTNDEFLASGPSKAYLKSIEVPADYDEEGGELIVISACERDHKNWETIEKSTGIGYGSLTYCVGKLLDNDVPLADWENFFASKEYRTYRIFRSTQHPVVTHH